MIEYKKVASLLNKHKKRDSWFLDDYSVNPYEGCGFNCTYCYVRGSKYGENLSERIVIKKDAVAILDKQLSNRAKKIQYGFIAVGSATDAYMQVEQETGLTREILQIILKHRFPVFISTKSALVKRDIDLLRQIDEKAILPYDLKNMFNRGLILSFSFSTLNEDLAEKLEPGAPSPLERIGTLKECKEQGLFCGVNAIPLLPFISDIDEELEKMIKTAKESGADFILTGSLTLFGSGERDSKSLYFRFLENEFPHLLEPYRKMYGTVYYPSWKYHEDLKRRAGFFCEKYHIKNSIL